VSRRVAQSETIAGPAGRLEALVEESAEETMPGGAPRFAAVICHPHPLFGGTLRNKVVHTLASALREPGAVTLRFNFRGVGASEGTHDGGAGETGDAQAVIAWARARWPGVPLVLAGFSFGGAIAIRAAALSQPQWLISVAPAVDRVSLAGVVLPDCPWLIVQGEADEVVAPASVIDWATQHAPHAKLRLLPGVGHFFHGRLHELVGCIRAEWPPNLERLEKQKGLD
jgi:alpha/beta superfamily hydrolase